jgi:hypothetical protein
MLYRVIEHYEDLPKEKPMPMHDCLICLEYTTRNKLTPIDWKNQNVYLKTCDCGGWMHADCLTQWYDVSGRCPICRYFIMKKETMTSNALFYANTYGKTGAIYFIYLCNVLWFLLGWGVLGAICIRQVYIVYLQNNEVR